MSDPPSVPWDQISAIVFDMDGTLYDQRLLRKRMVPRLGFYALTRVDITLLKVISALRRERESLAEAECSPFEDTLIANVAQATGATPDRVRFVLNDWLETRPLPLLAPCIVPGTAALFKALRATGRGVAILSDYPASAKLQALKLEADRVFAATDPDIAIQKPSPKGLERAATHFGLTPGAVLMIGDRDERDGEAARRAGAPYLIRGRDFDTFEDPLFAPLHDHPPMSQPA